ncbi:AAA family ATPase [Azohydromonas lata]|uniref:ATP-binding protein n=1 Tax=Azohydromonas lata TaxID=45677 RepID=A0ABU5IB66_9BURK|nr:ATP-binding protein [Azohydromonas lata]MDZ5455910.1 ATP-binding protein [Azohydromonas lata]
MLLEYGLKNFFSFKEGVSISFRLDSNCPKSISHGKKYSPAICMKGANGSGKTHLLKGLAFVADFAAKSFSSAPEEGLAFDNFFNSQEPSEFFVEFEVNGVEYLYELSAMPSGVEREAIYKTQKRKTKIIERLKNEIVFVAKSLANFKVMKLRSNASLISTAHQYDLSELRDVHLFFSGVISNLTFGGTREEGFDIKKISKFLSSNKEYLEFTENFIAGCDVGIKKIRIVEVDDEAAKGHYPVFLHEVNGEYKPVTPITESSGTRQLFKSLTVYKAALEAGGVLVLDEFDMYLHPHILPKLLEFFVDEEKNKNNAQIIFSTHNSEIMDFMGRYRTYLVNKRENESFAYRLDEIPGDVLRNDRSIVSPYNEGKVGGVPRL